MKNKCVKKAVFLREQSEWFGKSQRKIAKKIAFE